MQMSGQNQLDVMSLNHESFSQGNLTCFNLTHIMSHRKGWLSWPWGWGIKNVSIYRIWSLSVPWCQTTKTSGQVNIHLKGNTNLTQTRIKSTLRCRTSTYIDIQCSILNVQLVKLGFEPFQRTYWSGVGWPIILRFSIKSSGIGPSCIMEVAYILSKSLGIS
jgi:hypothetical protein